jgi:hypothetical protein
MKNLDLFVLACVIITIVLAIIILIKVNNSKQHYTSFNSTDTYSYCVVKLDDNNPVLPSPSAKCTYSFPSKRINDDLVSIPNEPDEATITIQDFFGNANGGYVLSTGAPDGYDIGLWSRKTSQQSIILNITSGWEVIGFYALVPCSGSNCGP